MFFAHIKKQILLSFIICLSVTTYSCSNQVTDETKNVNEVLYKLINADNRSDIESVLNSYTDSIEFYPTGRNFIKGLKDVRTSYEKLFKENKLNIITNILETRVFGEQAILTGLNKGSRTSIIDSSINKIDDKYIAILVRNQKSEWKIDKLIWGINQ